MQGDSLSFSEAPFEVPKRKKDEEKLIEGKVNGFKVQAAAKAAATVGCACGGSIPEYPPC